MLTSDFVNFFKAVEKIQKRKDNYLGSSDNDLVTTGVYVVYHDNKVLMLGMDGAMFYWEALADLKPDDPYAAGWVKDGVLPCKFYYPELCKVATLVNMEKQKNPHLGIATLTPKGDRDVAFELSVGGKPVTLTAHKVDADNARKFTNLYDQMVLRGDLDSLKRKPMVGGKSWHSLISLTSALDWLGSHGAVKAKNRSGNSAVCMDIYSVKDSDGKWEPNFMDMRMDDVPDMPQCGAIIMMMRQPAQNPYGEDD